MATSNKVIITCAVTGAIHTPTMSPHLPITPGEIAEAAIGAAEAGAAIVHLHARDPETGRPDQRPEAFAPFLPIIKQRTNAVINLTSGGSPTMRVEERVKPAAFFKPEVASLNMGSINFALFPMLNRYKNFKFDWEQPYLEGTRDLIFRNTFKDIEFVLATCQNNQTRFEFECYDIGHLYNLAHFLDRGLVKPPLFVQSVFGILGGIGTHPEDVMHMRRTADRLLGRDNYRWSVLGAGRAQMPIAAMAAAMGGNVRVGLEDSLWIGPGKLAESNAQQVQAGPPDRRGPRPHHRDARRGARDPRPQGRRQGRVLGRFRHSGARAKLANPESRQEDAPGSSSRSRRQVRSEAISTIEFVAEAAVDSGFASFARAPE